VIKRVVAYAKGDDLAASRDFYVEVLGFEVAMEDPVLGLTSPTNPTAQVLIPPRGMENPPPRLGIDVGEPEAVDAAHAEAVRRGLRVVYPLTNEPWGVRRFFIEDPGGTVVNVLAHLPWSVSPSAATERGRSHRRGDHDQPQICGEPGAKTTSGCRLPLGGETGEGVRKRTSDPAPGARSVLGLHKSKPPRVCAPTGDQAEGEDAGVEPLRFLLNEAVDLEVAIGRPRNRWGRRWRSW
jgi:catechol 2,3-dioxygenase-like lactoylglutathione lyase family enzyme